MVDIACRLDCGEIKAESRSNKRCKGDERANVHREPLQLLGRDRRKLLAPDGTGASENLRICITASTVRVLTSDEA